ncbi:LysR family transcriptional regulator [Rothia nasisuis]|uniref:LysR family transcriptional regulator n=1 Tax=Rothia nasisuis TaxID=2109647 RepID=UPI001F2BEEB7|nr:LysR family transcriptional regulator [Rothia nasisuis]
MQPSFDYLRTFVAVFRTGSFTSAAKFVGLSQPAVTSQMQALERQLGYPLFERHGRRTSPTARAQALAAKVAPHIDSLDAITDRDDDLPPEQARVIHLGGPAEYLSIRVIPLLSQLTESKVEFRVSFGLADKLLSDLSVGIFDIVVSAIYPRLRGIASTPLIDEEFVLVASPRWCDTATDDDNPVTAETLRHVPLVAYGEDLAIVRRYWRTVFEQSTEGLNLVATIPNLRAIADAVIHGLGMSVLPRYLVEEPLRAGELVTLFEPEMAPLNTLHVATQKGILHKDRTVRLVQDALLADAQRTARAS